MSRESDGPHPQRYEYDRDKYGRTLASVEVTGVDIAQTLLAEGLARPYEGGTR